MTLSDPVNRKPFIQFLSDRLQLLVAIGIVIYLVIFAFNSLTRTGSFSPDSMNYVNVARNILAGRGITQPTLGFNQPNFSIDEKIPTPLTVQAPLYPLLIALVSRTGISSNNSALLIPVVAYGLVLLSVYKLAGELYDDDIALAATGVLTVYEPLRAISHYALSDSVATAFAFLALWLLVTRADEKKNWFLFSAGLTAGLALATRYAFLPIVAVSGLFLLTTSAPWRRKLIQTGFYSLGFAIPAGIVWVRNFVINGSIMPFSEPGHTTLAKNLIAGRVLAERYVAGLSPNWQLGLLGMSLLVFAGMLIARRQFSAVIRDLFYSHGRYVLILWSAGYLIFIIIVKTHSYSGTEGRFLIPTGIILVLLWSALAIRATQLSSLWVRPIVLGMILLVIGREVVVGRSRPLLDFRRTVDSSEYLTWLAQYSSNRDLIIGTDTVDIPFLLDRPATLSFSTFLYTDQATHEKVTAYAQKHCHEYQNIYLILRRNPKPYCRNEEQWRYWYGDFFADLRFGHLERYPDIIRLRQLKDGFIFQVVCL